MKKVDEKVKDYLKRANKIVNYFANEQGVDVEVRHERDVIEIAKMIQKEEHESS